MKNIVISICITRYNEDLNSLLRLLCNEIDSYAFPINIFINDDASTEVFPIDLVKSYLHIETNSVNIGRAANRNVLSARAEGKYLLFLDGDVIPDRINFLENYLNLISTHKVEVCSGGISYPEIYPPQERALHYRYGKLRESRTTSDIHLKTSNLLIKRDLMLKYPFDESLKTYGHEDTLLSYRLKEVGKRIVQLNNPVIHGGIMTNAEFMDKQDQALSSLCKLHLDGFTKMTNLQKVYSKYKGNILLSLAANKVFNHSLRKHLIQHPYTSLRVLDLYKVGRFHRLLHKEGEV